MTLMLNTLTAVSSVDGRYGSKTASLRDYFSEYALIKYRVKVEVEYFIALCELPLPQLKGINTSVFPQLRAVVEDLSEEDAQAIKNIEKTTNHDVKAVEYFLKDKFAQLGLGESIEFIHFGLTSQDINNTATPMMLKDGMNAEILPSLSAVMDLIKDKAN